MKTRVQRSHSRSLFDGPSHSFEKSPRFKHNLSTTDQGASCLDIPNIDKYSKITRPSLDPVKRQKINDKITLELHAENKTSDRIKDNRLFINYSQNPFSEVHRKYSHPSFRKIEGSVSASNLKKKSNYNKPHDNKENSTIIDAINNLKATNFKRKN